MKIEKILNNNVVVTLNDQGKELIAMGRGLAFKRKIGDELQPERIEKTFTLSDESISSKFQELLSAIPMNHVLLSERIINYAKIKLGKKLSDTIYVTLPDHISGAIQRYQQNIVMKNPLLWDIKRFYRDEFAVGLKANKIVEEETGVRFLEDEAAFIALHFANAQLDGGEDISNTYRITTVMQEVSEIVKNFFNLEFDENSLAYYRFITHLKFFAQRLLNGTHYNDDVQDLLAVVELKHKKALECVKEIKKFVADQYGYEMYDEETLYLTVHIARIVKNLD